MKTITHDVGTEENPDVSDSTAALLRDALSLARARRRLETRRDEIVAETDRVILELHETHGFPAVVLSDLLGVSKQRMSQLLADARKRRDSAAEDAEP